MGRTLNAITIKSSNFLHRKIQKNKKTLTGQPKKNKNKKCPRQTTTNTNREQTPLVPTQELTESPAHSMPTNSWPIIPVQAICKVSEVHACAPHPQAPKKEQTPA